MTPSEAATIVAYLAAAYEHDYPEATRIVWLEALGDLDFAQGMTAARRHVSTCRFRPSVSELRQAAGTQPPEALDAWESVCRSVARNGWDGDHSDVSEPVATVARQMGWREIGMSHTDEPWMRKDFIARYEAKTERLEREQVALGSAVSDLEELIAGIGNGGDR